MEATDLFMFADDLWDRLNQLGVPMHLAVPITTRRAEVSGISDRSAA
ncbi:MAG TPA: hypothetical protein VF533_24335 [Solirubrobacteraceae bacterium]|jgi:hypothetical protein